MNIEVSDASFSYGETNVFNKLSFSVNTGQILCLLGPNGSGKSTLIKCLAKIMPLNSGEICIDGTDIRHLSHKAFARKIAYIPQSSAPIFPFLVRDLAAMGRTPHKGFFTSPEPADYRIVANVLENLGIAHLEYKNCTELSGGERQLVLFATAIVQEPQILLLDETTSHLDFGNQMRVLKIIKEFAGKGISIIMATHSPEQVFLTGDLAAILKNGEISVWGTPQEVITEQNISSAFGIAVKILDVDSDRNIKTCVPLIN